VTEAERPPREHPIRVLIVDDHVVVRAGLARLLDGWSTMTVVATAGDGHEAIELAAAHGPDIVLMDLSMPGMSGVDATRRIVAGSSTVQVIVLTSFDEGPTIAAALDAGAVGYLLKDSDPADLRRGIESAAAGGSPLDPRVARSILAARREERVPPTLTEREIEVLGLLREGLANKEIAVRLGITVKTVKAHLSSLFSKIGVQDRMQAALWAERSTLDPSRPADT
jgi:DNA-binding NarL/FixJ family response regulator